MNKLFSPLQLRGLTLKNRIVVSPMQQYSTPDGIVGDWHMVHVGSRAVGGAGLIIAESTAVSPEGRSTTDDTGMWNNQQAESWRLIVDFVHKQGAKIAIQLGHFGSKASRNHPKQGFNPIPPEAGGWQTVSSSAVKPFPGMLMPKALNITEIAEVQAAFVAAAKRAVSVGFDSIELHGAHGYLFHQFYSSMINQRKDQYGGSFENRIRFLVETAEAVRAAIPVDMPLMVRLSAVDFLDEPQAWQLKDTVRLAAVLQAVGVDLITASAGGFVYLDKSKVYPNYQVPYATAIKEETGMPVGAVGLITTPQQAEDILQEGKAGVVVMAREFLLDPCFGLHAAVELGEAIEFPIPYKRAFH